MFLGKRMDLNGFEIDLAPIDMEIWQEQKRRQRSWEFIHNTHQYTIYTYITYYLDEANSPCREKNPKAGRTKERKAEPYWIKWFGCGELSNLEPSLQPFRAMPRLWLSARCHNCACCYSRQSVMVSFNFVARGWFYQKHFGLGRSKKVNGPNRNGLKPIFCCELVPLGAFSMKFHWMNPLAFRRP